MQEDLHWMQLALAEGEKAIYEAPPNPAVGCVIVKDGQEIARGHTRAPGGNHAEIEAIEAAKRLGYTLKGATVYVTLEPCSHQGRTPPCAQRLLREGVARVVYAIEDPNPLVAGAGARILKEAGVAVQGALCEEQARWAHRGFFSRMTRSLPWTRLKVAVSLDGRTALSNGVSQWITGEAAREDAQRYRARAQALLTGIGTVLADDPQMNVRLTEALPSPAKFVIDPEAKTPLAARILTGEPTTLFVSSQADASRVAALRQCGVRLVALPVDEHGRFDLKEVLREIARQGANELHVEAGAGLNGALLEAGLVDELLVYMAPALLGPGLALAALPELKSLEGISRWRLKQLERVGEDVRFVLVKPTSNS